MPMIEPWQLRVDKHPPHCTITLNPALSNNITPGGVESKCFMSELALAPGKVCRPVFDN